jgi:hypothetical protein
LVDHDLFYPGTQSGLPLELEPRQIRKELIKTIQQDLLRIRPILHIPAANRHHGIRQRSEKSLLRRGIPRPCILDLIRYIHIRCLKPLITGTNAGPPVRVARCPKKVKVFSRSQPKILPASFGRPKKVSQKMLKRLGVNKLIIVPSPNQ